MFLSALLTVLFINLLLGQYSPAFSQSITKSCVVKNSSEKLTLKSLSNEFIYTDSLKPVYKSGLPPITAENLVLEFLIGSGIGFLSAFATAFLTFGITGAKYDVGGGGNISETEGILMLSLFAVAQVFGSTAGVWMIGANKDNVSANYGVTLLGATGGLAAEIGLFALASVFLEDDNGLGYLFVGLGLTMPAVGSMIGFNSTRYYKKPVNKKSGSFINFSKNGFALSNPVLYRERDKSIHRKPITYLRLISVNL
ncbi:MAG: hypothetical protein MUE56_02290 [Ignavibacteria bacterium]|nr:hypothetical protein [Ignavibacteria bacterium]